MKAPKYVIAPEGCSSYLTPGKQYEVLDFRPDEAYGGYFNAATDDLGIHSFRLGQCYHLNGGDWIIPDDDAEAVQDDNGGPAFPCADYTTEHGDMVIPTTVQGGMSLRAYAAVAAMQGMPDYADDQGFNADEALRARAEWAVRQADALLAALKGDRHD